MRSTDYDPPSLRTRMRMQRVRRRDTPFEIAVRSILHSAGCRFFVDQGIAGIPRHRADIVFPGSRIAVCIDGCFWHGCPKHCTMPQRNRAWWRSKIQHNRDRDLRFRLEARKRGWLVLRFWEHRDPAIVAKSIERSISVRKRPKPR
jgi:DNA mismatch endonuclease (patch repair protein)